MLTPVVVGTHPDRTGWLDDCLTSVRATSSPRRRIHIHRTGGYEPAAIRAGCAVFSRFLFIHDSVTILHRDFWTTIDTVTGPAWLAGYPPMQLAIHEAARILPLLPDHEVDKYESIQMETSWPRVLDYATIWPDVTDANALRHEYRHGRDNLVLGNHLFEKHKGSWGQA